MDGIGQLEDAKAVEREQAVQLDQGKWELVSFDVTQVARSNLLAVR